MFNREQNRENRIATDIQQLKCQLKCQRSANTQTHNPERRQGG
jgi:hypothetical protein